MEKRGVYITPVIFRERMRGLAPGSTATTPPNKAACIYNNYLETSDAKSRRPYEEIAARCEELQAAQKKNANAYYLAAYALGRYGQLIGVAKALTRALAARCVPRSTPRSSSTETRRRAHRASAPSTPKSSEKVGSMIGKMTYGASKEAAVETTTKPSSSTRLRHRPHRNGGRPPQTVRRQEDEGRREALRGSSSL